MQRTSRQSTITWQCRTTKAAEGGHGRAALTLGMVRVPTCHVFYFYFVCKANRHKTQILDGQLKKSKDVTVDVAKALAWYQRCVAIGEPPHADVAKS